MNKYQEFLNTGLIFTLETFIPCKKIVGLGEPGAMNFDIPKFCKKLGVFYKFFHSNKK